MNPRSHTRQVPLLQVEQFGLHGIEIIGVEFAEIQLLDELSINPKLQVAQVLLGQKAQCASEQLLIEPLNAVLLVMVVFVPLAFSILVMFVTLIVEHWPLEFNVKFAKHCSHALMTTKHLAQVKSAGQL